MNNGMNNEMNNYGMNLNNRCTTQRGVSTFTDGCDLTSIYSVCATQDNAEYVKLKKRETIKKNQMSESTKRTR